PHRHGIHRSDCNAWPAKNSESGRRPFRNREDWPRRDFAISRFQMARGLLTGLQVSLEDILTLVRCCLRSGATPPPRPVPSAGAGRFFSSAKLRFLTPDAWTLCLLDGSLGAEARHARHEPRGSSV